MQNYVRKQIFAFMGEEGANSAMGSGTPQL